MRVKLGAGLGWRPPSNQRSLARRARRVAQKPNTGVGPGEAREGLRPHEARRGTLTLDRHERVWRGAGRGAEGGAGPGAGRGARGSPAKSSLIFAETSWWMARSKGVPPRL
eukprot:scaffold75364_cov57-Phaeocystis_antarctica.AAC.3